MADYKKMYYTLFNQMTEIIEQLQTAQQVTEEMFIESEESSADISETLECIEEDEPKTIKSDEGMEKLKALRMRIAYEITYTLRNFANRNTLKKKKF